MNIFKICLHAALIAASFLNADISHPSDDRDWENWKEPDVAQLIHEYWTQSQYELNHRKTLARLIKSLYLPGESFLEAGCGSGLVYQQLVPNIMDNQHYNGIDITQNMLDIARRDYPNGIFLKDDLYNLSFGDNSFEIVAAFEVLGHLRDIAMPIKEMLRVASRQVVFTVWASDSTCVSKEQFGNTQFIHTAFSHTDIMNIIANATGDDYTVKTTPLNGTQSTAYVISILKDPHLQPHTTGQNVTAVSP